ncbi:SPFH domain-containing protein [Clostridiales bacterium FE2011]|nr:SPFH domain-containing protein [Clostridiales bacterium FE2011]
MALFKKNPNEVAYTGGKKHWADVIKNTGPGELLIWRQPEEDFNTNSTVIVMPGEEAIFIKGGTVEQVFQNGTYKLSTENYPFISRLRNAFTGGISTFNCVVYFVRKADSQEIRWGTDSPIQVRDKVWGVRTDAKVRGAYKVRIINPAKFLEKLVGNNVPYQLQEDLYKYFSTEFQGKIKTGISKFLNSLDQELIGIDAYIDELSDKIEPYIDEALDDYGLKCVKFSLAGLDIDTTKYDVIDQSQMELIARQRGYTGDKVGLEILGTDWGRVKGAEILRDMANNPGAGGTAAAGAGLGMGIGAAGAFGAIAQQVFAPAYNGFAPQTPQPYQQPTSGRFGQVSQNQSATSQTSVQSSASSSDRVTKLRELKTMLDEGLIDQAEYDATKADILREMRG